MIIKNERKKYASDITDSQWAMIKSLLPKSGIFAAKKAIPKYPSIQRFCADAGYRNSFDKDIESKLNRGVDTSSRIKSDWEIIHKRWTVERTFSWFNNSRRLSKDYEVSLLSAQSMCMIAAFRTLISRF